MMYHSISGPGQVRRNLESMVARSSAGPEELLL